MFINHGIKKDGTLVISCCHGAGARSDSALYYVMMKGPSGRATHEIADTELEAHLTSLQVAGGYTKVAFTGDVNLTRPQAPWVNPVFSNNTLSNILGRVPLTLTLVSGNLPTVQHAESTFKEESVQKILSEYPTTINLMLKGTRAPHATFSPYIQLPPTPSPTSTSSSSSSDLTSPPSSESPPPTSPSTNDTDAPSPSPTVSGAGGGAPVVLTVDFKKALAEIKPDKDNDVDDVT